MLLTNWVRIGMSGKTTDGRTIKPEWLEQAAKNYNTDLYTANINYEHKTYYGNFGQVQALKTEVENGKTCLYAKLHPDAELVELNRQGNKLFTSMEITRKFADTGEAYLTGLAVTDTPASLGTQKLEFTQENEPMVFVSEALEFDFKAVEDAAEPENELSLFTRLGAKLGFKITGNEAEKDTELTEAVNDAAQAVELFNELKTLLTEQANQAEQANEAEPIDLSHFVTVESNQQLADDLAALKADYADTQAALADVTEKLTAALAEVPSPNPLHTNSNSDSRRCL